LVKKGRLRLKVTHIHRRKSGELPSAIVHPLPREMEGAENSMVAGRTRKSPGTLQERSADGSFSYGEKFYLSLE